MKNYYFVTFFYTSRDGKMLLANSFINIHPLLWYQALKRDDWNYPPEGIVWWTEITEDDYNRCKSDWF